MKDYLLEIRCDDEELVQSRLYLTASTGNTTAGDLLVAYFDSPDDRDAAAELLRDIEGIELDTTERERLDWLDLYQQSLEPLFIGERFVVAPDEALIPPDSERLRIVVPQEQAFGTGSHETTSLCIELLESMELQGKEGLDIGSGSGILAIAMLRLGARRVIAFDNDPDAYGALRDNRLRNGIAERAMPLFIGSIEALRGGAFDVITMNIIPEVILPLLPEVVGRVRGKLILSGILATRSGDVVEAARAHGLELEREVNKGEWWAGTFSAPLLSSWA